MAIPSSASNLRLPTEIPWKWLATSQDMMDTSFGDRTFPLKWRTSLSMFYYQPEIDDEDLYPDSNIVYLKVVCSITGYQASEEELGIKVDNPREWDKRVLRNFQQIIESYYPCYGAILQVTAFPNDTRSRSSIPLREYPRFIDFEPKKRELFEIVTQTGETLSRSVNSLQVGKNNTLTNSMETVDIDKGFDFSASQKAPSGVGGSGGASGSIGFGRDYEQGYRAGSGFQNVNFRTIDDSREKRETLSYTTQLAQMYHLLDSYHLGTNRALFTIFPRPHTVDLELGRNTKWLRKLEGIQEFFLVVEQPQNIEGICFEAQLDTAHLYTAIHTEQRGTTRYERGSLTHTIDDQKDGDTSQPYPIPVPPGYKVDRSRGAGGGYDEVINQGDDVTEQAYRSSVTVNDDGIIVVVNYDPAALIPGDTAFFDAVYTVYYISEAPVETPTTVTVEDAALFMTGRYLHGCMRMRHDDDDNSGETPTDVLKPGWKTDGFVTYEEQLPFEYWQVAAEHEVKRTDADEMESTARVKELDRYIRDRSVTSVNSPNRYPAGQHTILETDFVTRNLLRGVGGKGMDRSAFETKVKVPEHLVEQLSSEEREALGNKPMSWLLQTETTSLQRSLGLSSKSVFDLKLANLAVPRVSPEIKGKIVDIRNGNAVTEMRLDRFVELGIQIGQTIEVEFENKRKIQCRYRENYSDVPEGEYVALFGKGEVLKIAINGGNLAEQLGLAVSDRVIVRKLNHNAVDSGKDTTSQSQ